MTGHVTLQPPHPAHLSLAFVVFKRVTPELTSVITGDKHTRPMHRLQLGNTQRSSLAKLAARRPSVPPVMEILLAQKCWAPLAWRLVRQPSTTAPGSSRGRFPDWGRVR